MASVSSACVEPDEDRDDDRVPGLLLPPDDRLWRHPSEVALTAHARAANAASPFVAAPGGQVGESRVWSVALVSGVIGALLATAAVYAAGGATHRVVVPALERDVDAGPVVTLASSGSASGFVLGAERVQSSCVVLVAHDSHGTRVSNGVVFRSDGMILTTAHTVAGSPRRWR